MPYYTYVLQSEKTGRLYIGQTRDLTKRVQEHNDGLSRSTKGHIPWKLLHFEELANRHEAMKLEHELKKWKSKVRVLEWIDRQVIEDEGVQLGGNVWEWCWDWYDGNYYESSKNSRDPKGPKLSSRLRQIFF